MSRLTPSSETSTPTSMPPHQYARAQSEVSDVIMLDAAPENPEDISSVYSTPSSTQLQSSVTAMGSESEVEMLPKSVAASPLFRLPRELRETIWAYCLVGQWPILWPSETNDTGLAIHLLRVCQPIYDEAAPILYSNNTLNFQHPSDANMFRWAHNERLGIFKVDAQNSTVYLTLQFFLQGKQSQDFSSTSATATSASSGPPIWARAFRPEAYCMTIRTYRPSTSLSSPGTGTFFPARPRTSFGAGHMIGRSRTFV